MGLPVLELTVLRWEVKQLVQKDEALNPLLDDEGQPIVEDAWVIITFAIGKNEFPVEMECKEFEQFVLPKILDPMIRFWRAVPVGHQLFAKREAALEWLLNQKTKYAHVLGEEA
jgi:hypothetical protein